MKTQSTHAHEDRLLDFAYDELPRAEAVLVEQHLEGCSRCTATLRDIRSVRGTMSHLPRVSAPDAGLESLLAYAQQSARRSATGAEPTPRWWRRLMAPALSVATLGVVGLVVVRTNQELSPPSLQAAPAVPVSAKREAESAMAAAPAPAAPPSTRVSEEVSERHTRYDNRVREQQRVEPLAKALPSRGAPSKGLFGLNRAASDDEAEGYGSGGGFPAKKRAAEPTAAARQQPASSKTSAALPARDKDSSDALMMAEAPPPPPPAPVATAPEMKSPGASVEASRGRAEAAPQRKAWEREVVSLRSAVAAGSRDVSVLFRLCQAEAALGQHDKAMKSCGRVVLEAPDSNEARQAQRLIDEQLLP
ncbi:zf-HC2 domain-containing protein [Melittangium boletus]|uniref:zf-HC2 domain-containing protein n=1 Tax=Melittangium boletus TaxID=83453 RepID=UPI003DA1CC1F